MEFYYWLEVVAVGIMATALGAPVGDVLKWLLWKVIATAREGLSQGWGYVGAVQNATPGVQIIPRANADADDFTDSESGEIVNFANGGESSAGKPDGNN